MTIGRRGRDALSASPLSRARRFWLLSAILLISVNLRPGITSVGPLIETIRAELALGHAAASLLTAIPLLCMGAFPFLVAPLAARVGLERGLLWMLLLIAVATLGRAVGPGGLLLFATALAIGVGIAIAQAIVPGIVKRHFRTRAASIMSLYSMGMTLGAGLAAALTVPLQALVGGWPAALGSWGLPTLVAAALWAPFARGDRTGAEAGAGGGALPWRSAIAWRITLFSGGAFSLFWATQTWLAPLYEEAGWSAARAGLLLGVMTAGQIVVQLTLAVVADRWRDRRPLIGAGLVMAIIGLAAVAAAPGAAPWLWAVLLGLGIGTVFPLALTLPIDYARDPVAASRLTAMGLSGGYLLAGAAPVLLGWMRATTGAFLLPFLALAIVGVGLLALTAALRPPSSRPTLS